MFALCSDSRKGSWRHAETLLATAGSTDIMLVPPRSTKSAPTTFFSFLQRGNSQVGRKTKSNSLWFDAKTFVKFWRNANIFLATSLQKPCFQIPRNPESASWKCVGFVDCCVCWAPESRCRLLCDHLPRLCIRLYRFCLWCRLLCDHLPTFSPCFTFKCKFFVPQDWPYLLTSLELTRIKLCALHRNAFYEITSMMLKPATMLVSLLKANTTWQVFGGCPVLSPTC